MRGLFYILLLSFSPCVYRFANLRPVSRICQWLPNSKSLVCVNLSPKEHRRLKAGNLEAIEKTYSKHTKKKAARGLNKASAFASLYLTQLSILYLSSRLYGLWVHYSCSFGWNNDTDLSRQTKTKTDPAHAIDILDASFFCREGNIFWTQSS